MSFLKDKCKIKFSDDIKYTDLGDGQTRCVINYTINLFDYGKDPIDDFAIGISTCHKDDEYDFEIGKKIARAKAENKAYRRLIKIISKLTEKLKNEVEDLTEVEEKLDTYYSHNLDYINRISSNKKVEEENETSKSSNEFSFLKEILDKKSFEEFKELIEEEYNLLKKGCTVDLSSIYSAIKDKNDVSKKRPKEKINEVKEDKTYNTKKVCHKCDCKEPVDQTIHLAIIKPYRSVFDDWFNFWI